MIIRNASLEIKDEDENTIASIDGETGAAMFSKGNAMLNADGSGWLANKNIVWEKEGNPIFNGIVTSTDEEGNKIIVNAGNRSIRLVNPKNELMGSWTYTKEQGDYYATMNLNSFYDNEGEAPSSLTGSILMNPLFGISIRDGKGNTMARMSIDRCSFSVNQIIMDNIPTSIEAAYPNGLYRSGHHLMIK